MVHARLAVCRPAQKQKPLLAGVDRQPSDLGVFTGGNRAFAAGQHFARVRVLHAPAEIRGFQRVVRENNCLLPAAHLVHHGDARLLGAANPVVRQLFPVGIVDYRVRNLRPAVNHIPPDNAAAPPFQAARVLNEEFHGLGLRKLRDACELVQPVRLLPAQQAHLIGHQTVAAAETGLDAHVLGGVNRPRAVVHRPQLFGGKELGQRVRRRAAVVARFADERRGRMLVKVVLVEGARPPRVLLGHVVGAEAVRNFRRGAQEEAIRIVRLKRANQRFVRHAVVARVVGRQVEAHVLVVDLVIARPQRQRRVVADAPGDVRRFVVHHARERVVLRIVGVAHAEILPHEHAVFVAQVEEAVALIHAAAPAAQHVAAAVMNQRHGRVHAVLVVAVHRVQRNPVGAAHHQAHAVHGNLEFLAAALEAALQRERTQADALGYAVDHLAVAQKRERDGVQVLRAVAPRPPEERMLDGHFTVVAHEPYRRFPLKRVRAAHARQARGEALQRVRIRLKAEGVFQQSRVARAVDLGHGVVGFRDARGALFDQPHAAPQAAGHQTGRDVPAEAVRGLSDVADFVAVRRAAHADGVFAAARVVHGGMNVHDQAVVRFAKQIRHVRLVLDEHVFRAEQMCAVQINVGDGVDAVKAQKYARARLRRGRVKARFVNPLVILVFCRVQLLLVPVRVAHHARVHQRALAVARHIGLHARPRLKHVRPEGFFLAALFRRVIQRPFAVQRKQGSVHVRFLISMVSGFL